MCVLDRIFFLLKEEGKSQVDLAKFLGVSKNNISEWRHGRNRSYEKYLYQIAAFLGTSPEYLKGETDIKTAYIYGSAETTKPTGVTDGLTDVEEKLLLTFRSLNGEGQEKIVIYADDLADSGKYKKEDSVRVVGK